MRAHPASGRGLPWFTAGDSPRSWPSAAVLTGLVWSWSAGAPRPLRAFEPPPGVLPLSAGDPGVPALSSGLNDTFYFGGTRWAPDSSRWEAIPDSVWTFETGVGSHYQHPPGSCKDPSFHALMEGWVGRRTSGLRVRSPDSAGWAQATSRARPVSAPRGASAAATRSGRGSWRPKPIRLLGQRSGLREQLGHLDRQGRSPTTMQGA